MRKDLILVAGLTGLTVSNAIAGEAPSSNDRATGAVPEFRGETPETLGARGTIGQDATGFTGQERIGTLPPGGLGFRKTNDYDKEFERANEEIKERERSGEPSPFDRTGVGNPASSETGRASQLDPGSKVNAPDAIIKDSQTTPPAKSIGAAASSSDSGPADAKATAPTDNYGVKPAPPASVAVQSNNSVEDRQMSARLHRELLNATVPSGSSKLAPRQLRHVQVKASNNGEVTLFGTVATKEEKREIESMVKEMRGVSSVNNQLSIKGADGKTDNLPESTKP